MSEGTLRIEKRLFRIKIGENKGAPSGEVKDFEKSRTMLKKPKGGPLYFFLFRT